MGNFFTQLPNYLWDRDDLTAYDRIILIHIVRKTIGWGKTSDGISLSQFSNDLGISKNTAIKAIKSLIDKEIITQKKQKLSNGGDGFNFYEISKNIIEKVNESLTKNTDSGVHEMNRGSSRDEHGGVHEMNRGSSRDEHTKETKTKETNTKEKRLRKEEKKQPFLLPDFVNKNAWEEFEQHRKEIKKPMTDLARKKATNLLKGLSSEQQQQTVDYSIAGRYPNLYPEQIAKKQLNQQGGVDECFTDEYWAAVENA